QLSYLNESATRVRKAVTFPLSTFISILVTSAMRRSRSELAAVSTATRPASSQDFSLTPTTSIMRYTLSECCFAMIDPFVVKIKTHAITNPHVCGQSLDQDVPVRRLSPMDTRDQN